MAQHFLSDLRLYSGGKLYTWTGHDDNYLKYDLWRASASAGMTIHNISADGEIYLKSGNATTLTLDSSQNATFAGDVSLGDNKEIILGGATDFKIYHNSTTNVNHVSSLLDRQLSLNANIIQLTNQANNSTYLLLNSTGGTFAGDVQIDGGNLGIGTAPTSRNLSVFRSTAGSVANFLHYTDASNFSGLYINVSQADDEVILNASGSSGAAFVFQQGNSTSLTLDTSLNATFVGDVTVTGGDLSLGADVKIYRDGVNILRTDDTLHANANLHVGGGGIIYNRADTNNYIKFNSPNVQIKGHLLPDSDGSYKLGLGSGTNLRWNGIEFTSGADIIWANGDAKISEGDDDNYSLNFFTYDGSALSKALQLKGDNSASFDSGKLIIDNVSANGRIHGTSSIFLGGVSTTLVQLSAKLIPDADSSRDLGTTTRYWKDAYIDNITTTGNINVDSNGATIFDNSNNNNAWYIRNGGTNSATLQFGLGDSPGSNIKHTFDGSGNVEFAGNIRTTEDIGRDDHNRIMFSTDDSLIFRVADSHRFRMDSDNFSPYVDSSYDLGTSSLYFRHGYIDAITTTGNVIIGGDLQVSGITTTTNVVNLDLEDNIIGLNRGSTSNANDSGLIIERGSTGDNAAFLWDEGDDAFVFGTTTATPAATGNITYAWSPIKAGDATFEDQVNIKRSGVNASTSLQQTGTGLIVNAPNGYHPLVIKHNTTEQYRFTNTGYFGIGDFSSANPALALDVKGTTNLASRFMFTKDLSTDKVLFGGADHDTFAAPFIGSSSNHTFTITQNGSAAITIDTDKTSTFAGDLAIKGAALQTYQQFNSDPVSSSDGNNLFSIGGQGMVAGYSRNISIWSTTQGVYRSWVGTNLRWDGTNYKRASNAANNNWGNVAGIEFKGGSSGSDKTISFYVDEPENASGGDTDGTVGTSIPSAWKALEIDNNRRVYGYGNFYIDGYSYFGAAFYDQSNTAFYVDPAGTSVVNHMDMDSGNTSGKFAVMSSGVHGSYDLYNDGTTYLNGATIIDDNLTLNEYIYHQGDTDTYLRFETNNVVLAAGAAGYMQLKSNGDLQLVPEYTTDDAVHYIELGRVAGSNNGFSTGDNPVHVTVLGGYSVGYNVTNGTRLCNEGFLMWHSGGGWTGNQRHWAMTNAYDMGGTGGPKFALLLGDDNTTEPTLADNGQLGTDTSVATYWKNDKRMIHTGVLQVESNVQSPIFYDSANTAYYVNPNGNSVLSGNLSIQATANGIQFTNHADGNSFITVNHSGNESWYFKAASASGSTDYIGIGASGGGEVKIYEDGKIEHQGLNSLSSGTNVDQIKEFQMSFQLVANTWTDTGIDGSDLATGTYAMQVYVDDHSVGGSHYDEYYSGMVSWFGTQTNETAHATDEIPTHRAGHAPNDGFVQFRTTRGSSADLKLQVKHNEAYSAALDNSNNKKMTFNFRRLI